MRIGMVAPPWAPVPPSGYGGIEAALHQLVLGLQRAGDDVVLFTTGEATAPVERAWVFDHALSGDIGADLPQLRHVMAAYEATYDCDVVHDHTVLGPAWAAALGRRPVVTTMHGPFEQHARPVYRRYAQTCSIVCISQHQRASFAELPVAAVIHHGVDVDQFPIGRGDGGYALFLGRMAPEKGAHRAIAAAARARIPLVLAAKLREPAEHRYFDEFVRPRLGPGCEYLGEVDHTTKLELLADARCLLFPIEWPEPFGMVMIEALACGTPVLAFPWGAAPEVVDEGSTGFLCSDVAAMAGAIARLDRLDRTRCRAAVVTRFSTEAMVHQHRALYRRLAGDAVPTMPDETPHAGVALA